MSTLQVVVGGQYGSEAKGHVTQRLAERSHAEGHITQVIRVAGPNAGHTGYDRDGQAWALRQVPVAAVVDGPLVLGIGAGSEIDLPVLLDEIDRLTEAGLMRNKTFWVSREATMIDWTHKDAETDGKLVDKIGSTGKGIGAARADRIWRKARRLEDDQAARNALIERGAILMDAGFSPSAGPVGTTIIEGTQGYGLGLRAGHYPKCTSSDCRATDFIAMAGVNPWSFTDVGVWVVARIYPIRVAGNSGPLKDETTWEALGLPEERTTVTRKVRRVGGEDWDLVADAVKANGGSPTVRLAVTMLDQKFRDLANVQYQVGEEPEVDEYLSEVSQMTGSKVGMVTTGPNTASWLL